MELNLVFKKLVDDGVKLNDGTPITEKILNIAENNLASKRRKTLKKENNPDYKLPNKAILEKYVTAEDIVRNIPSIMSLAKRNEARANGELPEKEKEITFDDIRNMRLGIDNLEGYKEAEKQIIQKRLNELSQDFNLEKTTDKFLAWRVALCELKIMQLETLAILNPKEATKCQTQVDLLDKQYKVFCESLNVLKRQRDVAKEKPKDTNIDLTNAISQLDKSIIDMQLEVEREKQQEQEMTRKILKKDKKSVKEDK